MTLIYRSDNYFSLFWEHTFCLLPSTLHTWATRRHYTLFANDVITLRAVLRHVVLGVGSAHDKVRFSVFDITRTLTLTEVSRKSRLGDGQHGVWLCEFSASVSTNTRRTQNMSTVHTAVLHITVFISVIHHSTQPARWLRLMASMVVYGKIAPLWRLLIVSNCCDKCNGVRY